MDEDKKKQEKDKEIEVERDENLDDSIIADENLAETVKKLREKLKVCQTEKSEYLNGWQRSQADFVNYKKREAEEVKRLLKFAAEPILTDVIGILDSFELAFGNEEWKKLDPKWRDGVEMIHSQLLKVLEKHTVSIDNPIGEIFDPASHMAVETIPGKEEDNGKILSVLQKGYRLNGQVIRPAKVRVGNVERRT